MTVRLVFGSVECCLMKACQAGILNENMSFSNH